MTEHFSRPIMISAGGHLLVLLLIFFRAVTLPQERFDVSNAIRVDVVGLPKKMEALPEKPAPPPPKPVAEVLKPAQAEPLKPAPPVIPTKAKKVNTGKAEKHALEELKAMEALDDIKKEMNKPKPSVTLKAAVVAGNTLAAGNSLTGLEKIEYDRYFDQLKAKIDGQWNIPQWLADADLKAQVLVVIDEKGFVIKKVMRKASGNDVFDAKVMEAIETSSPLPPPPERLRGLLSTSGIVFNFPR